MRPESYTFACPACGTQLSVPRSLAGVQGPCPECHQEITAPEPTGRAFPAPVAEPPAAVARAAAAPVAAAPAVEAAGKAPASESPARGAGRSAGRVHSQRSPEDHGTGRIGKEVGRRRSSPLLAVCGAIVVIGLAVAAAGLSFLPAGTLQTWLRLASKSVQGAIPGTGTDSTDRAEQKTAPEKTDTPAPEPTETASPTNRTPSPDPATPTAAAVSHAPHPEPVGSTHPEPKPQEATAENDTSSTQPATPEPSAVSTPPATPEVAKPTDPPVRPAETPSLLPDLERPAEPPESQANATPAVENPTPEHAAPLKALDDFLGAANWKERLAYCLNPEQVSTEMAEYYSTTKDGPHPYTSALFRASSPLPGPQYAVHLFHVTFADLPQGFPIPVEQTDRGWKIDWRAFIEFREGRLKKFLGKYQDPPAVFRAHLRRAHYYDKGGPTLDQKYCFRVSAPIDGHDGYVFVDKRDSTALPKLEGKLDWDLVHQVMVKLKWVKGAAGHPYVELRDITANSWRDESIPRVGQK